MKNTCEKTGQKQQVSPYLYPGVVSKILPLNVNSGKIYYTIQYIKNTVCDYFNMPPPLIQIKTRKREIKDVRQIIHYFCKEYSKASLATIGREIGGKDHATVLHSCKTVNNLKDTDAEYRRNIEEIDRSINGVK